MRKVEPQVFLISEPRLLKDELKAYLEKIGAANWQSGASTDIGTTIETMGKVCYRSFEPGLNPNVKKIRREHKDYVENILKAGHGSVIEHGQLSFIFFNVSRVFTHELVRHRVGVSISQESMRFVRLNDIPFWFPQWAEKDKELLERCLGVLRVLEEHQRWMAEHFNLDAEGVSFHEKKAKTSFMRRFAPEGVTTTIGWSANLRAIRWTLEARTDSGAEEEIRLVFHKVGEIVQSRYRPFFDDFEKAPVEGSDIPHWKPLYRKV
jgi:thymidylate synthase (FAD)